MVDITYNQSRFVIQQTRWSFPDKKSVSSLLKSPKEATHCHHVLTVSQTEQTLLIPFQQFSLGDRQPLQVCPLLVFFSSSYAIVWFDAMMLTNDFISLSSFKIYYSDLKSLKFY
ncbi:hypothetical protein O6H91_20G039900 [Diphasiastrum complanatum]|uniref:Uncharacterized protein n=1 Tax=Diphasiastrum complanatum TaxID=34168 RepID=A0ACC2APS4_DIPCM|nr:hypothetical protein O6H91_20G039900 [Diphasiastrum complanatum]